MPPGLVELDLESCGARPLGRPPSCAGAFLRRALQALQILTALAVTPMDDAKAVFARVRAGKILPTAGGTGAVQLAFIKVFVLDELWLVDPQDSGRLATTSAAGCLVVSVWHKEQEALFWGSTCSGNPRRHGV